jgi:capsular polysaccharide biosynthesis protein
LHEFPGATAGEHPATLRRTSHKGGGLESNRLPPGHGWDSGPGVIEAVWRFRWLVAAAALVSMLAGAGFSLLQSPVYEAEARLLLTDPRTLAVFPSIGRSNVNMTRHLRNQAQVIQSQAVAARAAEILGPDFSATDVLSVITTQSAEDVDLLSIRARAGTAEDAVAIADAVARAYQDRSKAEIQDNAQSAIAELDLQKADLQRRITAAERGLEGDTGNSALRAERDAAIGQLMTIEGRADQIAVDTALYGTGVDLYEPPELPGSPVEPRPLRSTLLATALGLAAASGLAWWRAQHTQLAEQPQDPAKVLGAPLLGEIPDYSETGLPGPAPTITAPHSPTAEAYQFVVASLEFALSEIGGTTVLVTSAGPGDGKTVTALNLAIAGAQDGRRVLLVDADERMRGLTKLSELSPGPGLTDLADENLPFRSGVANWVLSERIHLPFVPAGTELEDPASSPASPARTAPTSPSCCSRRATRSTASSAAPRTFNTDRIDHLYQDPHEPARAVPPLRRPDRRHRSCGVILRSQPDEVYNLGAQSHVRCRFDQPEYTADVDGDRARCGCSRRPRRTGSTGRPIRFYQAGSSEMFGKVPPPQTETTPFYPRSPYACAKVFAHWMTVNYREAYGLHASNGILFNHESPRRGETFVTRKITRAVAASSWACRTSSTSATSTRARLGLRRRLRRGDVADAPAGRARRLRHRHRRDALGPRVLRARLRPVGSTGNGTSRSTRATSARPRSTARPARPGRAPSLLLRRWQSG